jgi:hypothetical protein
VDDEDSQGLGVVGLEALHQELDEAVLEVMSKRKKG